MRRALFRVDACPQIGYGHFYRCLSLANMISEEFEITFAMGGLEESVLNMLKAQGFPIIELEVFKYTTPDQRGTEELPFDLSEILDEFDCVVLDGYWFGPVYQTKLRSYDVRIVIIEDTGGGVYLADVIINAALGLYASNYTTDNPDAVMMLGIDYVMLRSGFLRQAKEGLNLKQRKNTEVLICFGGSDIFNKTEEVSNWFLDNTQMSIHIVTGVGYLFHSALENLKGEYPERCRISTGLNEEQMINAMMSASLGVVPSSGILFECMACRLPVISGMYTENQGRIYHGLVSERVFLTANDFSDNELESAWNEFNRVSPDSIRANQARMVDGKSADRFKRIFTEIC